MTLGPLSPSCWKAKIELKCYMTNPNPDAHAAVGVATEPEGDFDHERFIDHVFDALTVRETEIRRWFEAEGFVDVRVRRLPLCGPDGWECLMLRHHQRGRCTCDDVKALVIRLAGELRSVVHEDDIWAVVCKDRVGAQFRLKPQPRQPC
jgi:hypothetical protein